jgi:hypothetical protein
VSYGRRQKAEGKRQKAEGKRQREKNGCQVVSVVRFVLTHLSTAIKPIDRLKQPASRLFPFPPSPSIAVATTVRTGTCLWARSARPQTCPKSNGSSYTPCLLPPALCLPLLPSAFCLLPSTSCPLPSPSAFCLLPPAFSLLPSAFPFCLLPFASCLLPPAPCHTLQTHKCTPPTRNQR